MSRAVDVFELKQSRRMLEVDYVTFTSLRREPGEPRPAASIIRNGYGFTPNAIAYKTEPVQEFLWPDGRSVYVAMAPELREMLEECIESNLLTAKQRDCERFMRERDEARELHGRSSDVVVKLAGGIERFLALPWYRRVWRALTGDIL